MPYIVFLKCMKSGPSGSSYSTSKPGSQRETETDGAFRRAKQRGVKDGKRKLLTFTAGERTLPVPS